MIRKAFLCMVVLVLSVVAHAQLSGAYTYDFRDGTIITAGQSTDGNLTLSGTYKLHGDKYGLNMKVDSNINITVTGSSTIRFLGSAYSSLKLKGTATTDGDLGTQNTKVANDLSDTYDFVYDGPAATLNFKTVAGSGNDLYLPTIEVIPSQLGKDATAAEKNIVYFFDLRDGSIIPTTTDGKSDLSVGLFGLTVGTSNAYGFNGDTHGSILKTGNKITLPVAGNSYIKLGGCIYSNGSVTATSTSGNFDKSSMNTQAASEYHQEGTTLDFLYVGEAGTVTLEFTSGTTYIPVIEIVPVTYEVSLVSWVKKSGTITINGTTINLTAGDDASSNATVTVSDGLVNSATADMASIRINLGGKSLSKYTAAVTGDIASATASGDTLFVTYADASTNPKTYKIVVADNSAIVKAEPGKTYSYNLADGSVMPANTTIMYSTFVSADGILNINGNDGKQFWFHDASHGGVFYDKNSFDIHVAGNATITFVTCTYSAAGSVFTVTDADNNVLGTMAADNNGGADSYASNFSYTGPAGVLKATLTSGGSVYIHALTIENAAKVEESNGLVDVWDFGAEQLDPSKYNNQLTEAIINSWYDPSIAVGSSSRTLPSFSAGVLSWIGGGNDRLRTTNTNLTRYDENISGVSGYTGRVYVNASANSGRYLSMALSEDDEITLMALSQNGTGLLNFQFMGNPEAQTDKTAIGLGITEVKFVAKAEGTYHIFDSQDKPSYYRIYRKDASYVTLSGSVDLSEADGISENYAVVFTNEAGKSWTSTMSGAGYSAKLPAGYSYELSLANANGYIISTASTVAVSDTTTTFDVAIKKVQLFTISGIVTGLGNELSKLELVYTPDPSANKIFVPSPVIDKETGAYSVQLEGNCLYTISANGVNDFYIPLNTITTGIADQTSDVAFSAKPLYKVNIEASGLNAEQLGKLGLTFTNLNEQGYTYSFSSVENIMLRDGTYTIAYSGLNEYPLQLGPTSNLTVAGTDASKTLAFTAIRNWTFADQVITDGMANYEGLTFSGSVKNEIAKGHLVTKAEATVKIPVNAGDKVIVTYYYSADFSIEGTSYSTSSGSTSTLEYATYVYPGSDAGFVTITIGSGASTTYITNIFVDQVVAYTATIYVGVDKDYSTISDALAAVGKMDRPNNERVTVMIDPGNYEEMLVVNSANVTLKNAAEKPSIDLANKGVDIAEGAVRITSYYGHGYSYYSMGSDQKWNADVLRVNKENGYLSYVNKGSGTTNGSYWNATVVVAASGFEADNIIFENSFNQYISKKESEDVVEMWESGGKGIRPTDAGNTAVQNKSFVERGAAIAITNNTDKVVLNKCRVVGHQDSFFGGNNVRAFIYKGVMMGGTDFLFGGMDAVFYKSKLAMTTSNDGNDVSYLTAAQQSSGRGYLMYECNITSAQPGTDIAAANTSKPGYFGRPWQATTSEVVFYNTTIDASQFPGSEGKSLIQPVGWLSTLGGESKMMYEYGTKELSGENNQSSRASWSTVLTEPKLNDGTEITTFNFTKGNDGWDPLPELIAADQSSSDFVVSKILVGTVDSPEDYTCLLNMSWDASNIYLNFDITDDSIVNVGTSYQVDNLEVYFDMDNSKNIKWPRNGGWMSNDPTYDANDYQLRLVPDVDFSVNNTFTGATQTYQKTATGYQFALTIPWNALMEGFVPTAGTKIGFDVLASDNDAVASDANRNQVTLVSPTPNPYNDPSLFGTFQLEDAGAFAIIPDVEAPGVVSGLNAVSDKNSVTLSWENATDNIAILYYNVYQNGVLLANKVYPKETENTLKVSNLDDGNYTFEMETVDNFGNVSASKAAVDVTVSTVSVKSFSSKISVYPNPVLNELRIRGVENINKVEVIGLTGQVVKTYQGANTINVSDLSKGAYILKVQSNKEVLTTRFLKN